MPGPTAGLFWGARRRARGALRERCSSSGMGASSPIPLFNLGRQDLSWVILLSILCASVALIVRGGQGAHPEGRHAWKDLLVIVGSLGAFVLCGLAFIKLVYSYFHEPLDGVLFQGYTQLEDGAGTPPATVQTQEVEPQATAAQPPTRMIEPQILRPVSEAAPLGRPYRASYSPREEEDIECGLLIEASAVDFEYNGGRHQKGSLRVIKVERDGVCEVCICVCFRLHVSTSFCWSFRRVCGVKCVYLLRIVRALHV